MSSSEDIKDAIRSMSKSGDDTYSVLCTVSSIDTTKQTCVCVPKTGGADLLGVKLITKSQSGFYIIPKVDSDVIVVVNPIFAYVSMFSGVSEIQLNGDNYDGLVRVQELLTEINNRNTTLKTAITAALTSLDASIVSLGGASAASTAFTAATATIINILKSQVENTSVKHGNGI